MKSLSGETGQCGSRLGARLEVYQLGLVLLARAGQEASMTAIPTLRSGDPRENRGLRCEEYAAAEAELLAGALECFRAGRFAEAEEAFKHVHAQQPDHAICLHFLGLIAHRRGDHLAAAALIEKAVFIKPD
jgi:hypothetical protein